MRTFVIIFLLFALCSCATVEHSSFVSPSEALYHKATKAYERKEFSDAIKLYKEFLENTPKSDLTVSAQLNLGMSHYYLDFYKDAYSILNEVKLEDESIKSYVEGILKICRAKAGDEIEAQKKAKEAAAASQSTDGNVGLQVTDAYMDNFGTIVIEGRTGQIATVFVDGKKVSLDRNKRFSTRVPSWKKGQPIELTARGDGGGSEELDYFPDRENPDEPEGLSVINTGSNSIEIEWDENDEDDIKGYRLFYRLKGGSTIEVRELIEDTEYDIVGLEAKVEGANRTFQFYVRAVDKMDNESDDSDILEVDLP